jgi:hypothetical protein
LDLPLKIKNKFPNGPGTPSPLIPKLKKPELAPVDAASELLKQE